MKPENADLSVLWRETVSKGSILLGYLDLKYVSVMNTAWGVGGWSGWELPFFGKQIQIQKASTSAIYSRHTDLGSSRIGIRIQAHRIFSPILLPLCSGAKLCSQAQFQCGGDGGSGGGILPIPTNNSQTPCRCLEIQLNFDILYWEIASDSVG